MNFMELITKKYSQFIKFCMVGITNTLVGYGINVFTLYLLGNLGIWFDYIIANITAFVLGVLWSFIWNIRFVFKKNQSRNICILLKQLLGMYAAYAFTGIVLNNVLSYIWIDVLSISKMLAPLLNSAVGVPINYLLNKKLVFKE